jgi:hypothetical protein
MEKLKIPVYTTDGGAKLSYRAIVVGPVVIVHLYDGKDISTTYIIFTNTRNYGRSGPESPVDDFLDEKGIPYTDKPGTVGGRRRSMKRRSTKRRSTKRRRSTRKN